jgi:hypothetical protein
MQPQSILEYVDVYDRASDLRMSTHALCQRESNILIDTSVSLDRAPDRRHYWHLSYVANMLVPVRYPFDKHEHEQKSKESMRSNAEQNVYMVENKER